MNHLELLSKKIADKSATIGVIGLGYVGLPVAASFARAGYDVRGLDINFQRIEMINRGENPIQGYEPGLTELLSEVHESDRLSASSDYQSIVGTDVILIDVETPVDEMHVPRYEALESACRSLARHLRIGMLVIVESTISPGTVHNVVRPILDAVSGLSSGRDFYLGACPERVMPGRLLSNLRQMSRVCGGDSPETARVMAELYSQIVDAELDQTDILTSEVVKTTENAYRDVQIAFANEVALICESLGADVWKVREFVNKVPSRQMHLPGAGVGGHCIPKDPWLLANSVGPDVPIRLIPAARAINDGMPLHVAQLTLEALRYHRIDPEFAKVVILGYAYLAESDDTRKSPSKALEKLLVDSGVAVAVHDPWVEKYDGDLQTVLDGANVAVIMVAHKAYREFDPRLFAALMKTPIVIDGRHVLDKSVAEATGIDYWGVGQGKKFTNVPQ